MIKCCQPARNWGARFEARKALANVTRAVLITLICIYAIHVAAGLINVQSRSATTARAISKHQPVPFVPVEGQWSFKMDSRQSHSGLLPLPENARALCNRTSADGIVQLEIVNVSTSRAQLFEYWRSLGWEVRSSPYQRPGDIACFCRLGDAFVYAWSECKNGRIESLMLVNNPVRDTKQIIQTIRNAK